MRDSEKRFLALVGKEAIYLERIQEELQMSYEDVENLADYLKKEGLIRGGKVPTSVSPRGYLYLVCKPIDKRKWREKYWWVLSILTFLGGILTAYIKAKFF